jgi:topoisomerase IV subunit B
MAEQVGHGYTDDSIRTLDWREHIRARPGMYIGKLGDGSEPEDGIYVLLKEVLDNSVDEFAMGYGKRIDIFIEEGQGVEVRDYGRGIPLGKLMDCAAKINTGAKYDSEAFQRSVGLNGVGIKAVNALSSFFEVQSFREGKTRAIEFSQGLVTAEMKRAAATDEPDGTRLMFVPDDGHFTAGFRYQEPYVEEMLRFYAYLNPGLTLVLNGKKFRADRGILELLEAKLAGEALYPIIHLKGEDIEVAMTHIDDTNGEEYYSFVNGQHTTMGGTHLSAFREGMVKAVRDVAGKAYEAGDVRNGLVAVVSVKVQEPVFESQTKTKLGSTHMEPRGRVLRTHVAGFIERQLNNYLHKHGSAFESMKEKIGRSERERKELKGIQKAAKDASRRAKIHNKKLRDCRAHLDSRHKRREESTLFITEGDSASGSITKTRDPETQAVFSLRGKPLNVYGQSRKIVYQNEELNLLQNALGIEDGIDGLRYSKVVLATDADVDGMHIRLLLLTFFLQFFPELVRRGHVFILQTPLFRVRNKKETRYCYTDEERKRALDELGRAPEITRFKGLGEISPHEFKHFIGPDIRLEKVRLGVGETIPGILGFYMGKNTPQRQQFILGNLRVELDLVES